MLDKTISNIRTCLIVFTKYSDIALGASGFNIFITAAPSINNASLAGGSTDSGCGHKFSKKSTKVICPNCLFTEILEGKHYFHAVKVSRSL